MYDKDFNANEKIITKAKHFFPLKAICIICSLWQVPLTNRNFLFSYNFLYPAYFFKLVNQLFLLLLFFPSYFSFFQTRDNIYMWRVVVHHLTLYTYFRKLKCSHAFFLLLYFKTNFVAVFVVVLIIKSHLQSKMKKDERNDESKRKI